MAEDADVTRWVTLALSYRMSNSLSLRAVHHNRICFDFRKSPEMMARRQAGELRLPGELVRGAQPWMFMSAGRHEAQAFGRPSRQLPRDQQPEQRV